MSSNRGVWPVRVAPDALRRLLLRLGNEGLERGEVYEAACEHGFAESEVRDRLAALVARKWTRLERPQPGGSEPRPVAAPEGKDQLRALGATAQFNIRLPGRVRTELRTLARRGEVATALAVRALDEWVRLERFPGVDFRWTPSGRQPHVTGTGLTTWETFRVWLEHGESTAAMLEHHPHLRAAQVEVAIRYVREYQDEMPPGWGARPPCARAVEV